MSTPGAGPWLADSFVVEDLTMGYESDLRSVRDQLESLNLLRLGRPLGPADVRLYRLLCRQEHLILEARFTAELGASPGISQP